MRGKHANFHEALSNCQRLRGWTHKEIAERLGVDLRQMQNWLKPRSESRAVAPGWVYLALNALAYERPVTERRGGLEVTYTPIKLPPRNW
jgi:hypothetical protein